MLNRIVQTVLLLCLGAALLWWWVSSGFPTQGQICEYTQAGYKECTTNNIISVALWPVEKFLNDIAPALTAFATVAIALLTRRLWKINRSQLQRNRKVERAYVSGGGARTIVHRTSTSASAAPNSVITRRSDNGLYDIIEPINDFFDLHVNNHGKTPARLHHVRVGFCDASVPLPAVPPYEDRLPCSDAIGPGTQSRFLRQVRLTRRWTRTAICGRFYWIDIWNREWSSGFVYEIPLDRPASQNGSLSIESPSVYWEDRREPAISGV